MSNKTNTIVWQKWLDPFGEDDESSIEDILQNDIEDNNYIGNNYEDEDQQLSTKNSNLIKTNKEHIKVIATPMGIIPINENTCSGKIFNFWVGHTNFDITRNIAAIIESTDGVETLDVFTRYRFRISIGKAFNDSKVMRTINKNVYNYLE